MRDNAYLSDALSRRPPIQRQGGAADKLGAAWRTFRLNVASLGHALSWGMDG